MRRRHFIAVFGGAALAWPFAARAAGGPARIALLGSGAADTSAAFVDAFKEGLRGNGLIESRDYVLDVRWAEGVYERFPALARDVVQRDPRVILVTTIAAVRAAQRATTTIPIVMTTINNPVGAGLIASLARPGGNTTMRSSVLSHTGGRRTWSRWQRRCGSPDYPASQAGAEVGAPSHGVGPRLRAYGLFQASHPTRQDREDPPDQLRGLIQQSPKMGAIHDKQAEIGCRHDRRGSRLPIHQAHLAKTIPWL